MILSNRILALVGALMCFHGTSQTPMFQDFSAEAGLLGDYLNHTLAVADYDLDGDLDVYVGSRLAPNTLYRNEGDAVFTAVTAGVEDEGFTMASLFWDYDNDGDPDLWSCNSGDVNRFWRNDGGTFTELTDELGMGTEGQCRSVHAADVNRDGWLDLYVVNMNMPNELWVSDGAGGFMDGYANSGALDNLVGMGALFTDIENDGDLDLYLTHDANQANKLYINNGEGVFDEQAQQWGLNLAAQGMGVDAADLNHDGYMDLFISNNLPNDLFLNGGPQTAGAATVPFVNITDAAGVGDAGMGWGTVFIDHDHDGERDLYVANEYFFSPFENLLYHNNGDLTFTDVAPGTPLASPYSGYATVVADFDANGTEDLLVANTLTGANPGCQLFLNQDLGHHWIGFDLEGVVSPRDAAGARVVVHAGPDFVRTDESHLGHSYSSCGPLTFNFGLGNRTEVDSVEFFWPSGLRTVMAAPEIDQYHTVLETPCFGQDPGLDWDSATQLCPGDTLWLALPEGWTALSWTGGADGAWGRAFTEEGVAQALIQSGSGCTVLTDPVEVTVVQAVPPTVVLDGPSTFCQGELRALSVLGPQLDVIWSNGLTSSSVLMAESDTLTVTTTNICGHLDASAPIVLSVFDTPASPIVPPATVAIGGSHTFQPLVFDDADLRWSGPYSGDALDAALSGSAQVIGPWIETSATFTTPPLGATTGWWVRAEAQRDVRMAQGGKLTASSGGFINSDAYGLLFDAHEPLVLERVKVQAESAGPRTFTVSQQPAGVLASTTVALQEGWNEVELGFALDAGQDYSLTAEGEALGLWRDNAADELEYPYWIGELATITGSTIPNAAGLGYYYFFYDWEMSSQGTVCASPPVAAVVNVVEGIEGCTYPFAVNFNAQATLDDGSCVLGGCLDVTALNYSPYATVDDGSCTVQCASDLNGDGQIGAPDLLTLLAQWGSACD